MTHTFDGEYWDQIWRGDRAASMGSGQPNPHLLGEVSGLTPGTALDAGCGAGAEAIWLAKSGWQVSAVDIASAAIDRAAERAADAGLTGRITWIQADLSSWQPDMQFDLVTTHYAHPATPQLEFYARLASWVAPGGTLLIVGHLRRDTAAGDGHGHTHDEAHSGAHDRANDHANDGAHDHGGAHGSDGPPAAASATAATITALLDPTAWEIATAAESHRTVSGEDGADADLHDVVVRAARRC